VSLAHRLAGLRDLAVARGFLADRCATLGAPSFAQELEPLLARASAGHERERGAMVVVASFIAGACARGEAARLHALGAAAAEASLPLTHALFAEGEARKTLAPRGRLADGSIPVFADLSGLPWPKPAWQSAKEWREMRAWCARSPSAPLRSMLPRVEQMRAHHDPIFIARLLDQRWISERSVVAVAARRPTVAAIVLAVATRDRWFRVAAIRRAIEENPYAPPLLARALRVAGSRASALAAPAGESARL
jgi:hypothetical protein